MLSTRQGGGGTKLTYIEAWRVIQIANDIFGFSGWCSEIKTLEVDFVRAVISDRCDCGPDDVWLGVVFTPA